MYIRTYVCMRMYIRTYVCIVYVCACVCIYMCVCLSVCECMHAYMYVCMYGTALMQRRTRSKLTCLPLKDLLLETRHSTKNFESKSTRKLSLNNPSMNFHSVNALGEGGFK